MYCDWPRLGRCCFCMPLRLGVITFGYINIFISAIMISINSFYIHQDQNSTDLLDGYDRHMYDIYGSSIDIPAELSITFYCIDVFLSGLLIYGAHKKTVAYLKVYLYYTVATCVASLIMQIVDIFSKSTYFLIETCFLTIAVFFLQIYLVTMVWSLIKKLELSGSHAYNNALHEVVSGELQVERNGVYNNTTSTVVPPDV